jgi:HPt (histidine-containing phosphotransfer) domain-containing protein
MYEEDYGYICEMFQTTLNQLIPDVESAKTSYLQGDVQGLRKQVHKIKPAFGFVGLRETEALCQQFENQCLSVSSTDTLKVAFDNLADSFEEAKQIISKEIDQLKIYKS